MIGILEQPSLVLNKSWRPINFSTFKKSINKILSSSCLFINPETFETYDFQQWYDFRPSENVPSIDLGGKKFLSPEVVLSINYNGVPKNEIKLTRRNVLARDDYKCQYCGIKVVHGNLKKKGTKRLEEYTWDHVVPRSMGGQSAWTNLVTCCFKCNMRKASKSLDMSGLHLIKAPIKPKWGLHIGRDFSNSPESWKNFLSKGDMGSQSQSAYWDASLKS